MHSPAPEAPRFAMGEREFVALMALLQALQALAIDAMLPALGVMARELGGADANQRQLVIGLFLIGSGIGSLVPGALADRFGRKPVLLACLGGYIVLSLACALVTGIAVLLTIRFVLGLVTSGLMVLPMAIIRDRFAGDRMARTQSLVAMVFLIVPMLAPLLGQGIMAVAGWRWIFGFMAALALAIAGWAAVRLPETMHPEFRQAVRPRVIAGNMRVTLTCREAIGYVLGAALIQGTFFGYLNSSQQLVAERLGAGDAFPALFGLMALAMAFTNFGNARIVERLGARRVSQSALFAYIALGAVQLWFATSGRETLWHFVPLMTLTMCLMSFIGANFASIAIQPFARIAGSASSVQAFVRMATAASLGALIGQAFDGTARPFALAMLLAGCATLALVLYSERGRLFRRVHPPTA